MAQKNQSHSNKGKVMAGVGMAALAAAAAGAVFLYGTDAGKKRRKQIESWSLRMKADVIDSMKKMKDWSEDEYGDVVKSVSEKYKKMKNVDPAEVAALVGNLRSHWKMIKKEVEGTMKTTTPKKRAPAKKKAAPKTKSS